MKKEGFASVMLIVCVLALLLLGAEGCEEEEKEVEGRGLSAGFIEGAPPSQVSKGQVFRIYTLLRNEGAYAVKGGEARLYLEGIPAGSFSLSEGDIVKRNARLLRGASFEVPGGASERIVFSESARYVGDVVPFDQDIFLRSCYLYESASRAQVCYSIEEDSEICELDGEKLKNSGMAPVQVTSVVEERSGRNVLLKFKVENLGEGDVYLPLVNCDEPESWNKDMVYVSVVSADDVNCEASLGNKFTGTSELGVFTCVMNMENVREHVSPIEVRLRYVYEEVGQSSLMVTE